MASPSMCPGHFNTPPSEIEALARCRLFVRFDFQRGLDRPLADRGEMARQVAAVTAAGGLCVPDTYVSVCRQVADSLIQAGFVARPEANRRLEKLAQHMTLLRQDATLQIAAAHLSDLPVLTSGHQADFCRWLGLRVIAETSAADNSSVPDLDKAVKA